MISNGHKCIREKSVEETKEGRRGLKCVLEGYFSGCKNKYRGKIIQWGSQGDAVQDCMSSPSPFPVRLADYLTSSIGWRQGKGSGRERITYGSPRPALGHASRHIQTLGEAQHGMAWHGTAHNKTHSSRSRQRAEVQLCSFCSACVPV